MTNSFLEIIDRIQNGVILLDEEFKIVLWNGWLTELTGFRQVQVQNQSIFDIVTTLSKPTYRQMIKDVLDSGLSRFCSGMMHKLFVNPINFEGNKSYKQSMQIENLNINGGKYILIQVYDVTIEYERINKLKENIKLIQIK